MNPVKVIKAIEIVWLVVGCAAIGFAIYEAARQEWGDVGFLLFVTLVSGLMYYVRRRQRRRMEQREQ
jgi:hypothetical protein